MNCSVNWRKRWIYDRKSGKGRERPSRRNLFMVKQRERC